MNQKPTTVFVPHGPGGWIIQQQVNTPAVLELPPGTYTVTFCQKHGYGFAPMKDFKPPKKIYGNVKSLTERFVKSFEARDKNMGVMMLGRKGSGKTLTLMQLSARFLELGMPTIVINEPYSGSMFNDFLASIEQPCLVIYDEFDKLFAKDEAEANNPHGGSGHPRAQSSILQLLNGTVVGGKKLFAFSANSKDSISEFLINRPGRIRYTVEHHGMTDDAIIDYSRQNLNDKDDAKLAELLTLSRLINDFNFDLLQAIVEEMNLFKEDAYDAAENIVLTGVGHRGDEYVLNVFKGADRVDQTCLFASNLGRDEIVSGVEHKTGNGDEKTTIVLVEASFVEIGPELTDRTYTQGDYTYQLLLVPQSARSPFKRQVHGERRKTYNMIQTRLHEENQAKRKKQEEEQHAAALAAGFDPSMPLPPGFDPSNPNVMFGKFGQPFGGQRWGGPTGIAHPSSSNRMNVAQGAGHPLEAIASPALILAQAIVAGAQEALGGPANPSDEAETGPST